MRIARRGIIFGERSHFYDPDPEKQPDTGVGLLFMSFRGNLRQFAAQQAGSDTDGFPYNFQLGNAAFTGADNVIAPPDPQGT